MLATLIGTLIGLIVDPQAITGAPAWLKPTRFAISTSIYAFTFVWLLGFIRGHPRLVAFVGNATAVALTIEVGIIVLQVVRGTTSHFNYASPLDAALISTMGGFVVLVWALAAVTGGLLALQRLPSADSEAFAWSLRLAVLVALVGMAVAFLMVVPTRAQTAAMAAGSPSGFIGAHSVGVADGGPGLPLVGWSTLGGDLRVAHFFGLHALQVLPFIGWWLATRQPRLSDRHGIALVGTAGLAYLGLVALLTWQALRGQSVVAPDAATVAAWLALVGGASLVAGAIVVHARLASTASRHLATGGRVA
jgi:hypothetical protein